MKYANSNDVKIRAIEFVEYIFNYITDVQNSNSLWTRFLIVSVISIVILGLIILCCRGIVKLLESLAKFYISYRSGDQKIIASNRQKKNIQRRQQFCAVLDADLAYIDKAENWNDQYFTDLEAEVEAEGGYYISVFARLFGKKVSGIRRVPSLVNAIDSSTERAVLLVGEPGSGKSVALRHLAKQLAARGKTSQNPKTAIPLYLNLRELEAPPGVEINSDLIKSFVLDNIRRGDADTSAYVRENWAKNKDEGTWFFLFDSFDEIPGVLHAASESQNVKQYSMAIRQFLDGMGSCRSVLASREYKGPQSLPWQKFRLLQLNEERRHQLVANSFLSEDQINLVLRHLATGQSKLGNNPLFLTLLCRYVKDEETQPTNDHQLLETHIKRLATREPDYITRKYGITSEELLAGAQMLAIAFAENNALSLAPRLDEILSALGANTRFDINALENLLAALVDVKIGRNDVATAKQGDRRFAFSHRRYQETLFASYLATNPHHISALDLLSNKQWREYTVAILQSQDLVVIEPIIYAAESILHSIAQQQKICIYEESESISYGSFNWNENLLISVLEILQEGMSRRTSDVPNTLRTAIKEVIEPRWEVGDLLDKYLSIKLGGLLPPDLFNSYLGQALQLKIDDFEEIAFRQSIFLSSTSLQVEDKIRAKLATEALSADSTVRRVRLQALAAQLPESLGASHIIKRCQKMRPIYVFLNSIGRIVAFPDLIVRFLRWLLNRKRGRFIRAIDSFVPGRRYQGDWQWATAFLLGPAFLLSVTSSSLGRTGRLTGDATFATFTTYFQLDIIAYCGLYIFSFVLLAIAFRRRASHKPLAFGNLIINDDFVRLGSLAKKFAFSMGLIALLLGISWLLGKIMSLGLNYFSIVYEPRYAYIKLGTGFLLAIFTIASLVAIISLRRDDKRYLEKLRVLQKKGLSESEILSLASNMDELTTWLVSDIHFIFSDMRQVRYLAAVAVALIKGYPISNFNPVSSDDEPNRSIYIERFGRLIWVRIWAKNKAVREMSASIS